MAISPFVFSSESLPKLKAKQLFKAFPFLRLSVAQEATARALGYTSWYACAQRGTHGKPSPTNQEAGLPVRVARYYHQAGILMGMGITPSDADLWVRAWGLTGHPTLAPERAVPMYYVWNDTIERMERGEISEAQAVEEGDEGIFSKYPEIDHPQRVCPGVILGPSGKYPHYAVDPAINARIPIYLRGASNLYHYEDDGDVLAMAVPGFPKDAWYAEPYLPRLNRLQHEWHHGEKHPDCPNLCIPQLEAAALSAPDSMVVISVRNMPDSDDSRDFDRSAIACLRGRDFVSFLRAKGVVDPDKVIWYRNVDISLINGVWSGQLDGFERQMDMVLPVLVGAEKLQQSQPIYSYPFKVAPMHGDEYSVVFERIALLPLDEDYPDDDEDSSFGDSDPDGPINSLERALSN